MPRKDCAHSVRLSEREIAEYFSHKSGIFTEVGVLRTS